MQRREMRIFSVPSGRRWSARPPDKLEWGDTPPKPPAKGALPLWPPLNVLALVPNWRTVSRPDNERLHRLTEDFDCTEALGGVERGHLGVGRCIYHQLIAACSAL